MNTQSMKNLAKELGLTVIETPKGLNPRILWVEDNRTHSSGKNINIRGTSTEKIYDGTYGFKFQIVGDFNAYGGISFDNINVWRAATPEEALTKAFKKMTRKLARDYKVQF